MRLYLDLCCFNRPYDDQSHVRIRLETEAKLSLQEQIRAGVHELLWSSILDFENSKNPFVEHLHAIAQWSVLASNYVKIDPDVLSYAETLTARGVHAFDALHLACAVVGKADVFITTDDRLLRQASHLSEIKVFLPAEALAFLGDWYEQ